MVVTDPIADFLIRIKNGYLARKDLVAMPSSKIKENLAVILVKEGFLKSSKVKTEKSKVKGSEIKILVVELKYEGKRPVLSEVKRISKPGVRIYTKMKNIPEVRRGQGGLTILSTPQGLMTHQEAKQKKQGGEIICQIW
jgi:small subunit ribosomal protein S8